MEGKPLPACLKCNGTGMVQVQVKGKTVLRPCPVCGGTKKAGLRTK